VNLERSAAVLAPGYGGTSEQPIVRAMAQRLTTVGIQPLAISYSRARPSGDFSTELDDLRRARDGLIKSGIQHIALVGRSFGGRMCARLAALEPPEALVLLGHPISPPNRPRPDDEAALAALTCPTLIVQGDRDRLGPLAVLQRIAARNKHLEIVALPGVGHQFGPRQAQGIERAATWLSATLGRS
jgi:predicted alpha/beta-hydrolase family hydrolase